MSNWDSFKNKTVLITGASSGIGLALVNNLAKQGAKLILVARSADKLNETVALWETAPSIDNSD